MTDARREEQLRIQAVGAAISRRDWHAVEQAYNAIRDEFDRRHAPASGDKLIAEMQRRMGQPRYVDEEPNPYWLPIDDTQVGVEFAFEFLRARKALEDGKARLADAHYKNPPEA